MKKLNRSGIIMILIVIAGWLVLRFVTEPTYLIGILQGEYVNKTGELEAGKVIRVVDGDTLVIEVNGKHEKVRLIGIDTPESAGVFEENPELYGMEASEYAEELVLGKTVYLEKDESETDSYDRLLRYVWLSDAEDKGIEDMVNVRLIKAGYAALMTMEPDTKYQEEFEKILKKAQEEGRKLWEK